MKKGFLVLLVLLLVDAFVPAALPSACYDPGSVCGNNSDCPSVCGECCFEAGLGYATSWMCCGLVPGDPDGTGYCFCECSEGPPIPPPPGC